MKKSVFSIILVLCVVLTLSLTSCGDDEMIYVYAPDGAPALAVANIIDSGSIAGTKAAVTATTGEIVKSNCVNGQADIAVLPTNAAVKICSDNADYALFTVNVWGLLYVVGWDNITDLSDLQGKTVCSIGLGDTGEYLFKRILEYNGVDYDGDSGVDIRYVTDGTEAIGMLMADNCDFALLGEPAATNAINKAKANGRTLYRVFDIQQLWKTVTQSDSVGYPQASVIVKKSLLNRKGFADGLYNVLTENTAFLTENVNRLNEILQSAGSLLTVNYTAEILSGCNLKVVKSCEIKENIYQYLSQFNGPFASLLTDELYYEFDN